MTHLRIDDQVENSRRKFACGLGPDLPEGDQWVFKGEYSLHHMVDCPGCGGDLYVVLPKSVRASL